jgi:hypothetical protein
MHGYTPTERKIAALLQFALHAESLDAQKESSKII